MVTYLLTWNPGNWPWKAFTDDVATVAAGKSLKGTWSSGNTKKIKPGDRLFWLRQGREPRGIFASGFSTSKVYEDGHWSEDRAGDTALYIKVKYDAILDPDKEKIISTDELRMKISSEVHWEPFASGTSVPPVAAARLEKAWSKLLSALNADRKVQEVGSRRIWPDDLEDSQQFVEGAKRQVIVNAFERSDAARRACIDHWGERCSVCSMLFEEMYGELGAGFIHVHHLRPLAATRKQYKVDPVKDLRPVCPNCHAMLHQDSPPLSIDQLRESLSNSRSIRPRSR